MARLNPLQPAQLASDLLDKMPEALQQHFESLEPPAEKEELLISDLITSGDLVGFQAWLNKHHPVGALGGADRHQTENHKSLHRLLTHLSPLAFAKTYLKHHGGLEKGWGGLTQQGGLSLEGVGGGLSSADLFDAWGMASTRDVEAIWDDLTPTEQTGFSKHCQRGWEGAYEQCEGSLMGFMTNCGRLFFGSDLCQRLRWLPFLMKKETLELDFNDPTHRFALELTLLSQMPLNPRATEGDEGEFLEGVSRVQNDEEQLFLRFKARPPAEDWTVAFQAWKKQVHDPQDASRFKSLLWMRVITMDQARFAQFLMQENVWPNGHRLSFSMEEFEALGGWVFDEADDDTEPGNKIYSSQVPRSTDSFLSWETRYSHSLLGFLLLSQIEYKHSWLWRWWIQSEGFKQDWLSSKVCQREFLGMGVGHLAMDEALELFMQLNDHGVPIFAPDFNFQVQIRPLEVLFDRAGAVDFLKNWEGVERLLDQAPHWAEGLSAHVQNEECSESAEQLRARLEAWSLKRAMVGTSTANAKRGLKL